MVHISIYKRQFPIKSQYDWIYEMEPESSSRVWVGCRWCIWRPKISNYCMMLSNLCKKNYYLANYAMRATVAYLWIGQPIIIRPNKCHWNVNLLEVIFRRRERSIMSPVLKHWIKVELAKLSGVNLLRIMPNCSCGCASGLMAQNVRN